MAKTTEKAAIWCRVSTGRQDTTNQLAALRQMAKGRGFEVVKVYQLEESAFNGKHRVKLNEALEDARLGRYQVLLCWALDRISREDIEKMHATLRQFRERGVRVLSMQESFMEGPSEIQDLVVSVLAWVANWESKRRSERIKAGLARVRAADPNKHIGRPKGKKDKKKGSRPRSGYLARWAREREARA